MRSRYDLMRMMFARRGNGGGGPILGQLQSMNADGWSATYSSPPNFDPVNGPKLVSLTRQGYTTAGATTTYAEDLICTQRIRQAFPNDASLSVDQVALSDFVYSTDTIIGATNNSTETSPKPVANWARPDRGIVGNTLAKEKLEVVAFHRNARSREQVACVEWTITDGTNTVTVTASTSVVSGHSGDRQPVIVYRPASDVNISSLNDNATITINAKVYPWIGAAASVLDSSANSGLRAFSPRKMYRSTSLAAAPMFAYVNATTGNYTTGAVSTTAATAEATPCLTIQGAMLRAIAVNGNLNGLVIRVMNGGKTTLDNTGFGATLTSAEGNEVIVTRDPTATQAQAIIDIAAVTLRPRVGTAGGCIRFLDVTFDRTAGGFMGETASPLLVVFDSMIFDNNSVAASPLSTDCAGAWLGVEIQAPSTSLMTAGLRDNILIRGVLTGLSTLDVEMWCVLGCSITSMSNFAFGTKARSGFICAYNRVRDYNSGMSLDADTVGFAIVQNLWECIRTTTTYTLQTSGFNYTHGIIHHNTCTGFFSVGRDNLFYDQTSNPSTSKLNSVKGNIHNQLNNKGDRFDSNGALLGNWSYLYGVGCAGEFSQFIDAQNGGTGGTFAQAYPGLRAKLGTSNSVRNDPLFTSYQGTASGPTAGAGGGDYTVAGGSPAKAMADPVLRFDLAGNTRSAVLATAGAYE